MRAKFYSIFFIVVFLSSTSMSHILMKFPPPRNNNDGLKSPPCGNVAKTNNPMVMQAGSKITIQWDETINHPGYYRVAFSDGTDTQFEDRIIMNNIQDVEIGGVPRAYSQEITLPNEACENCTLQLFQFMAEDNEIYYSCADITLVASNSATPIATPNENVPPLPFDEELQSDDDGPRNTAFEVNSGCPSNRIDEADGFLILLLLVSVFFSYLATRKVH